MRLHIKTTPNDELIWFNYQPKLTGAIHKWMGKDNPIHGKPALHSFSWLREEEAQEGGLNFPRGSNFFISFHEDGLLKQVLKSIRKDPALFYGMEVKEVSIEENPDLTHKTFFRYASPIFIRRSIGDKDEHYTFEDKMVGDLLGETLSNKMQRAGLPIDETLRIQFDPRYQNRRIKIIDYKGIGNKVNLCPIIIEGKTETKLFAWNVGLGNSTGIGFGAIY